jgi:hypothetical protein
MCTEAVMAYPEGRLLAVRDSELYVLAAHGWSRIPADVPRNAMPLTREEAEDRCERQGWDLELLAAVPRYLA